MPNTQNRKRVTIKTKEWLLFLLMFLCFPIALLSQSTFLDSLKIIVPDATFAKRMKIKYQIQPYLDNILNVEERLQQAQQIVDITAKLKDSLLSIEAYRRLGQVYNTIGDTINSQQAYQQRQVLATQYGWSLGDINKSNNKVYLFRYLEIFKDESKQLNFDSIQLKSVDFKLNNTNVNVDTNAVYWYKVKLRGHPEQSDDYLFQISADYYGKNSWNKIDAYLVHEDGSIEQQQSGFALQKKDKAIPFPANLHRFSIAKNELVTLYLSVKGTLEGRAPESVNMLYVHKDYFKDLHGGYTFKGQFHNDFGYPYAFVSNYIYTHEIVEDSAGTMEIATVYEDWLSLERKDWMNIKPEVDKVYWLKAKFIGSPIFNGEQVIHVTDWASVDLRTFDYIDAYIPDGKGGFHHHRTGDKISLSERPYHFWATFLKVDVPLNDTLELFVRLEGADAQLIPQRILLTHVDQSSFWPDQINKALFYGMILGIFIVQFLYLFFLFLIEREWIHFYLSIFVVGCLLVNFYSGENFSSFVALPFPKGLLNQFNWLSLLLVFFGLIKFTQTYFNTPKAWRISKWVIPTYLSLLAIFIGFLCSNPTVVSMVINNLVKLFIPLGLLIILFLVFASKKQAHVSKGFYLIAFLPFIVAVVIGSLSNFLSEFGEMGAMLFPFSQVFALVMLALITGKRNKGLKEEREKALQKNLDNQKRNYEAQQHVNQAISRFVPNAFLNALGKSNITEIQLGDAVEKEVTICFTDIRDYTSLSEQLSPQENFKFVNDYNNRMGPIIQNYQGFVNQYLGDGIMAIFPNTAEDALNAAIDMQRAVQQYNLENTLRTTPPIKIGIGLHSGSLIMGITGDKNRMDAATVSDSVNTAARIENLTKYYGVSILLSEESLNKLANPTDFNCRYLGQVQVKGKQESIKIYECFDGDLPATVKLKLATHTNFNKGIQYYFQQAFEQATYAFEAVLQQHPTDATAKLFLTKAKWLLKTGIAENWTGIERMEKY